MISYSGYDILAAIVNSYNNRPAKNMTENNPLINIGELAALRGDLDLLVYNESRQDWFFVEVKEKDHITDNQKVLFPLIEKFLCRVFVDRVVGK